MYISSNPSMSLGSLFRTARPKGNWGRNGNSRVYEYSQAREAMADFVRAVGMKPGDSVLAPAYICSSAIEPFFRLGLTVVFYPVDRMLMPDLKAIRQLLSKQPRVILFVHYFGFLAQFSELVNECQERGIKIIEDCAHTLPSIDSHEMGRLGDLTIYSLAKLLPVPDGALVVVNNPELEWPDAPSGSNHRLTAVNMLWQAANTLEVAAGVSLRTRLRDKKNAGKMITGLREKSASPQTSASNGSLGTYHRFQMSSLTRWMNDRIDVAAVTRRRVENYKFLRSAIKDVMGAQAVFNDLDPAGAPLGLPVLVENRGAVRQRLIASGVDPRPIWSGLPPQVPAEGFADAHYIAAHNIVLPVHQDLTHRELTFLASTLDRAVAESGEAS